MTPPVVTPDLAELRRLADEATPGPWQIDHDGCCVYPTDQALLMGPVAHVAISADGTEADAAFIAAARSTIPALCDEADRLRGLLDRCQTALADLTESGHDTFVVSRRPFGAHDQLCRTCSGAWPCRYARARAVLAELRAAPADETKG